MTIINYSLIENQKTNKNKTKKTKKKTKPKTTLIYSVY